MLGYVVLAAVIFYALSLPTALWSRYVGPVSTPFVTVWTGYVAIGAVAVIALLVDIRRWRRRREERVLRRELLAELKARHAAHR